MRVPSPLVRRLAIAPLILAVELGVIVAAPVLTAIAALLSLLVGGRRPLRALALVLAYVTGHVAAVAGCAALWAARRTGRHGPHYAILRWFVGGVASMALRVARVRVTVHGSERAEAALSPDRPLVVLSIHSGEGDSLLVLDHLLRRHGRRPRIVMHELLSLDPLIDVIGRRLPNRFVDPRGGNTEVEIAAMSTGLGERDAVLIFPEGGNVTAERRRRAIQRLLHRGHHRQAQVRRRCGTSAHRDRAARWPRWRARPTPTSSSSPTTASLTRWARRGASCRIRHRSTSSSGCVRADELPEGQDARIDWLFDWWKRLDAWVEEKSSRER